LNYKHRMLLAEPSYHDDLYIVAYPKSGITWLSFLMANVIKLKNNLDQEINFFNVQDYIPDIHVSRNVSQNSIFKWPGFRIIKSHSGLNPYYTKVIYLVRDPRDVMVSYWHFASTLKQFNGSISELIRDEKLGIKAWADHVRSWLRVSPQIMFNIFKYEDIKTNTADTLRAVFTQLGYDISSDIISRAVEDSGFETMKEIEKRYATYNPTIYSEHSFVRKMGRKKDEISSEDLSYIDENARELMRLFSYMEQK